MSNFKPIDAKRDDFRKYLERTGALEAISKTFSKLLVLHSAERPENAIEFICENLGYTLHQNDLIESLKRDLDDSKDEIAQLKNAIDMMKNNKYTDNVLSNDENEEESDKPSSTTETLRSVTEIESQMKNLDIGKTDMDTDNFKKKLDEDVSSVSVQEECLHNIPVTAAEPQEEIQVTEEVK